MGRPPLDKKQRQLPVALPPDLRAHLESLSAQAGHSLAEEIRRRIERTIREDAMDGATRELRDGVVNIAAALHRDYKAEWHASSRARQALSAAIAQRLEGYAYLAKKRPSADEELFAPRGSPEDIGRIRESDDRHLNSYPMLNSSPPAKRQAKSISLVPGAASKKERDND
jgi:hypothetical protein